MDSYSTTDLYLAAAIIITSRVNPDRIWMPDDSEIAIVVWNDAAQIKETLVALLAGRLMVEIRHLRCQHIELKKKVNFLVDYRKEMRNEQGTKKTTADRPPQGGKRKEVAQGRV